MARQTSGQAKRERTLHQRRRKATRLRETRETLLLLLDQASGADAGALNKSYKIVGNALAEAQRQIGLAKDELDRYMDEEYCADIKSSRHRDELEFCNCTENEDGSLSWNGRRWWRES